MGRKEITEGITQLVRNTLRNRRIIFAEEVQFGGRGCIRPDIVAVDAYMGGLASIGNLEKAKVHCFEVKSSVADYKSGVGINLIGDFNYIVLPFEVYEKLQKSNELKHGANLEHIFPAPKGWRGGRLEEYKGQVEGWRVNLPSHTYEGSRSFPLSEFLWAMIYSRSGIVR